MSDSLLAACRTLTAADDAGFGAALSIAYGRIAGTDPGERRAAMAYLGDHVERVDPRHASWVAILVAALAEYDTDPTPAAAPILACLKTAAEAAAYFVDAWRDVTDERLPDPAGVPDRRIERMLRPELGDATAVVVEAWGSLPRWAAAAHAVLEASAEARRPRADTPQLVRVVAAAAAYCPQLHQVGELLRVLDGVQVLVLHRDTARGFVVAVGGIGDHRQLQTLLAGALVERYGLPGHPVDQRWVAAFVDADDDPAVPPVTGWWDLVGVDGEPLGTESTPADIPVVDGMRVLVLDPPTRRRTWRAGRRHPRLTGTLTVTGELSAGQLATWWHRVRPAPVG
ncbi:MAG TPA: hypothetical protein VGN37_09410 [Actinocatenispora sp.]